jgi:hypothetical protein
MVELMITIGVSSVVGLTICSILYSSLVLSSKNTAMNTAHHEARVALLNILEDIHGAVSLPTLTNASATPYPSPVPAQAAGISFQKWSSGPHEIKSDVPVGATQITLYLNTAPGNVAVTAGQHLIIPLHEIEADISAVSNSGGGTPTATVTLSNIYGPAVTPAVSYPAKTMPVAINGASSAAGDIACFITDRCSYTVANNILSWNYRGASRNLGNDIQNQTPFSIPTTAAGALYYRFVAAINLSTSDLSYSNRGYKSANIMLNGQVPQKARLTTYQ